MHDDLWDCSASLTLTLQTDAIIGTNSYFIFQKKVYTCIYDSSAQVEYTWTIFIVRWNRHRSRSKEAVWPRLSPGLNKYVYLQFSGYLAVAEPLYALTKKDVPLIQVDPEAFDHLKQDLLYSTS